MNATRISSHAGSCLLGSMLLMGCDEGADPSVAESSADPSPIGAAAECNVDFCDDFSDGTAANWELQGGLWEVIDGEYVGTAVADACPASGFSSNETLIAELRARNVDLRVDMRSQQRVDKAIVLRSTGPTDQIELNFRADPFSDLVVQELVGCELIFLVPPSEIRIPHQVGQTIQVRVNLVGDILRVWVDGELVLDRCIVFRARSGSMGLAVINGSETVGVTAFDNVQVDVLD